MNNPKIRINPKIAIKLLELLKEEELKHLTNLCRHGAVRPTNAQGVIDAARRKPNEHHACIISPQSAPLVRLFAKTTGINVTAMELSCVPVGKAYIIVNEDLKRQALKTDLTKNLFYTE